MFKKVLIANRGAIATRITRTLHEMNVQAVAIYAEADRDSLHVSAADESYSLGEGRASETYLNQQRIIEIAKQSGAEAIHPGYGFLSENPGFARLCEQNSIVFLGPTAEQMESFGLKHSARALAEENDVPLLPGTGLLTSLEDAVTQANDVGYPVMLKSTAGGGGIGMNRCDDEASLRQAFNSVKNLSANNFSNDGVFL
ncbi:biotin carboxylase N-terminal domain-containing protein, partial [Methylophaga sp. UBA3991]